MAEDVARALKAKSPMMVKFGEKECQVRPLGIRELAEVEQDCLERYKRTYLKTWSDNIDLIPNGEAALYDKLDEAAKWDIDDLPAKYAYDHNYVTVSKLLKNWLVSHFSLDLKRLGDDRARKLTASALDQEMLSPKEYEDLTSHNIKPEKVSYVN